MYSLHQQHMKDNAESKKQAGPDNAEERSAADIMNSVAGSFRDTMRRIMRDGSPMVTAESLLHMAHGDEDLMREGWEWLKQRRDDDWLSPHDLLKVIEEYEPFRHEAWDMLKKSDEPIRTEQLEKLMRFESIRGEVWERWKTVHAEYFHKRYRIVEGEWKDPWGRDPHEVLFGSDVSFLLGQIRQEGPFEEEAWKLLLMYGQRDILLKAMMASEKRRQEAFECLQLLHPEEYANRSVEKVMDDLRGHPRHDPPKPLAP
jgi:hypothetical protein